MSLSDTQAPDGLPVVHVIDERSKTDLQKAEDIAYTLNHTITCLSLDIFVPIISAYYTRWRHGKGSGHSHGVHGHVHDESFAEHLKEWFTGEIVGDLGAVPVTIGMQRLAPGLMTSLNTGLERLLGPLYRWGTERSTKEWAKDNHIEFGSPEYRQHADKLYHNEVSHLSQAATWTGAAFALNVITQKAMGSSYSTKEIIEGKLIGALMATTTVLGTRAIAPEKAHDWDEYTSRNIFVPTTEVVSRVLGIDSQAVKNVAQQELQEFEPAKKASHIHPDGVIAPQNEIARP